MKKILASALFFTATFASFPCSAFSEVLTYADLVRQLVNLESLALLPAPGESTAQWSSYDRASKYDEISDQYISWDANKDGEGFIRKEGDQFVLAEMEGPGVIYRIWSALPMRGHVKIYLDGSSEPAVDLPFMEYFTLKHEPFVYPSLVYDAAGGKNSYIPIPYQKSCKIVAEKGWGLYYQFTYRTYPEGTKLPTFKRVLSEEEKKVLQMVDHFLTNEIGKNPFYIFNQQREEKNELKQIVVPAGKKVKVAEIKGSRAIISFTVKMKLPEDTKEAGAILRELTLRMYWDKQKTPSVWSPLGDFFGTGPGFNKYQSLPMGVTENEFYSYWFMPFSEEAKIEIANEGSHERMLEFTITHVPIDKNKKYAHFHAKWHRDAYLPDDPERKIDWTILKTEGKGRFCGVMLHVWNPAGDWWGEGDEKFYVDGEKFPSTFGTGSEDYFGYAWGAPLLFQKAFHNQTLCENSNTGNISVNRWHLADNIPFQKSFEGVIEKYFSNKRPTLYSAVAYWYLSEDGVDGYEPVPLSDRIGYYLFPFQIFKVENAIEEEKLKISKLTGGQTRIQKMIRYGMGWSNNAQMVWMQGKPGDTLELLVIAEKTAKYQLLLQLTRSPGSAIVQLYLDGKKIGKPIDLYSENISPTGIMDLGVYELTPGGHKLTFEIVGANEKALKSYKVGIDFFKLKIMAP